jgi:serine/threonine protein kinase
VREIDALRRCSHPNIGGLVSDGTFRFENLDTDFTVEEFIGGGTLADRMGCKRIGPSEILSIGGALIQALAHITTLGIVHRDIKPANIMFRDDQITPVLVDFGLVRDLSRSSLTQSWLPMGPGTPLFAPPEQLNNAKEMIDWRSDQFSLGVTLALAHLGVHPYQNIGEPEIGGEVIARVAAYATPRRDLVQLCAESGLGCLARMVAPWPVMRYRTPVDLISAWEQQKGA